MIEQAEATLGPVDILVNNAAMSVFRNVIEWSPAKLRAMWEVNVMAPWELCATVVPGMIERGSGWIVNISTGIAEHDDPRAGGAAYGGTKAMFDTMTRCLALDSPRLLSRSTRCRRRRRRAPSSSTSSSIAVIEARDHRAARGHGRGDPCARDRAVRRAGS